jgi:DeoR/GlpR family transcriptional regulator of sugar metabolism
MRNELRWDEIAKLVDEHGYLSVQELSELCDTSIITIRRDLVHLDAENRLRRTHGGAASLQTQVKPESSPTPTRGKNTSQQIFNQVDALITSDALPWLSGLMSKSGGRWKIPVVAESIVVSDSETCIEVDNYQAGFELGRWAGNYAIQKWKGEACVLDLTYHRSNTQERSQGFLDGIHEMLPQAELRFSINTQSRIEMAYQLTLDALTTHPEINIIFAINDISAFGAYQACKELNLPKDQLIILPFGVEGPTMLSLIADGDWCAAGLCMFPEIVSAVCVEAAILAYNGQTLPPKLTTPFCIVTQENLTRYYERSGQDWKLQWTDLPCKTDLPLPFDFNHPNTNRRLPERVGFLYTYVEHEWYKSLVQSMSEYTTRLGIKLVVMDFEKTQKDELHLRRVEIARRAAREIKAGDTIFIDGGAISHELAEEVVNLHDITVITNSMTVMEVLKENANMTLISTGGALRRGSQAFVGPTAETTLKEFRIDKLFLMVSGVSSTFGLSHTNISEVTIKQLMIRSSREVILLADHSCFEQESLVQVAPMKVVHKLITDDALPASIRLELGTQGIQVILAAM